MPGQMIIWSSRLVWKNCALAFRRFYGAASESRSSPPVLNSRGDLLIDLVNRRVFVEGEEVHLTPTEYELLRVLASASG